MRGILSICVTCSLLLVASVHGEGNTTISANATVPATTATTTTASIAPNATTTTASIAPTATTTTASISSNTTITNVSATSATTTTTISPSNATTVSKASPAIPTGNTTEVNTMSLSTQNTSISNITGVTNNPNVTQSTTNKVTSPSITANPKPCGNSPCGNVTCKELYDDYYCQCPLGLVFNNTDLSCQRGESFYGEVTTDGTDFNPDITSPGYTAIYNRMIKNFENCFANTSEYLGTVILEIKQNPSKNARNAIMVTAKVSNIFLENSISQATVNEVIQKYSIANPFGTYAGKTICQSGVYCDAATTDCVENVSGENPECSCKNGFHSTQVTITTCRECQPDCKSSDNKQCKQGISDTEPPKCVCLPDYKATDGKCVECDFGYSGDDCKDNYLLILVIVGAVLGVAVLSLLGAVIGVSVRSKKGKSGERIELIDNDKMERSSPAPGSLFPKVQMRSDLGQVNQASNVYEDDEEEYKRSIPQRDYEENPWYEMARKDRNY